MAAPTEADAASAGLAVCWFGHSTALVEVDGYRVLTDPVWSRRCSPSRAVGPQRLHEVPVPLEALPAVDAVIISHDHYDHLDIDTIVGAGPHPARTVRRAARRGRAPAQVGDTRRAGSSNSTGTKAHRIGELTLVCTPARHFSGRFFSRNTTLWASWVIAGPRHRAFFGGDTGYTKSFAEIGADHGPFDLTLMPVGAYHPAWPDIHMNPEEAVRAHLDVTEPGPDCWCRSTGRRSGWPRIRGRNPSSGCIAAADPAGVEVAVPRPGERVDPDDLIDHRPVVAAVTG